MANIKILGQDPSTIVQWYNNDVVKIKKINANHWIAHQLTADEKQALKDARAARDADLDAADSAQKQADRTAEKTKIAGIDTDVDA